MTPTPHGPPDPNRCHSLCHHARGRHHLGATHHRALSPHPTALWPVANAQALPDTVRLAGWLGQVIVTLVTRHTHPRARVLLLASPNLSHAAPTVITGRRGSDPYAGLAEALPTIARLGRRVDTATAAPAPAHADQDPDSWRSRSRKARSRRRRSRLHPPPPTGPDHDLDSVYAHTGHRPRDQFDLIITAVHPHATDWAAHTDWTPLLTPAGTLAVLTHSDTTAGRLRDPLTLLVNTFRYHGLGWVDHIAVLDRPLLPATRAISTASPGPAESITHSRVHHDLLLFGPAPGATDSTTDQMRRDSDD